MNISENQPKVSGKSILYNSLEFFDDIDNLAELFWILQYSKTAPKYNLTQFSLHYR